MKSKRILTCLVTALVLAAGFQAKVHARQTPQSRAEINLSFAPVVKKTAPAVVNVYARRIVRERGFSPFADDPFFKRFFGNRGLLDRRRRGQNSLGSGVIVKPDGTIITNNHVIKGANDFRVVLADKREFSARLLLADPRTDLAILKIDTGGERLPVIQFGDSDSLEVGDLVLAIGNPFGVGQTVTSGIVSALARTRIGVSSYQFFIQTDAAINPGNSGGALIDMNGQLIGINTAIFTRSGGSNGIGFAIPVSMVRAILKARHKGGKIIRPWAGVKAQEVTSDIARSIGLDRPRGALVTSLHKSSPLRLAGLKRGDIIIEFDGKQIDSVKELQFRLATRVVGETATLKFLRRGRLYSATMDLIAPPEIPRRNLTVIRTRSPLSGLVVANISPAVAAEIGLVKADRGVVAMGFRRGIARRAGFRVGDVIVELNDVKINNVRQLVQVVEQNDGWWDIVIMRKGRLRRLRFGG